MLRRGHTGHVRDNFKPEGAHPRIDRAHLGHHGPLENKVGEKWIFLFLGGGPLEQGAQPCLISSPSPELWLCRCWGRLEFFFHMNDTSN